MPAQKPFPVIIAAPKRFTVVPRAEAEMWNTDFETIQSGKYGNLRLHRLSLLLDTGSAAQELAGVGYDGSLILPRSARYGSHEKALDGFNWLVSTLFFGGLLFPPVSSSQLAFGRLTAEGYFRYVDPIGSRAAIQQALVEKLTNDAFLDELHSPLVVPASSIVGAYRRGRAVTDALGDKIDVGGLTIAYGAYFDGRFRDAMNYGWVLVEQLLASIWNTLFLVDVSSMKFGGRKGALKQVAGSANGTIEMLVQADLVDETTWQSLTAARKARNRYFHEGAKPNEDACRNCLRAAVRLVDVICTHAGVPTDLKGWTERLKVKRVAREESIRPASEVDWSQKLVYRTVPPLPGEPTWKGSFETFPDIRIEAYES